MLARILIIFILLSNVTFAQLRSNYTKIDVDKGLSQNTVWQVIQDYKGFIWISTADGINKFDGYNLKHYKYDEKDPHSIYGIEYFYFIEDSLKQLWVAHSRGISIYDRINDRFDNIYKSNVGCSSIGNTNDGKIWFVEGFNKTITFEIKSKKLVKKNNIKFKSIDNSTTRTSVAVNDNLFYGSTNYNIIRVQKNVDTPQYITSNSEFGFNIGLLDNNTFIACNKQGIAHIYKVFGNKVNFVTKKINGLKLPNIASTIYRYNDELLMGGKNGLYKLNANTLELKEYVNSFENSSKSYNYIQTINTDKSNNLFISTNGQGIYIYSPYRNKFKTINTPYNDLNMVKSILKTSDGKIITGIYNRGLVIYDLKRNYQYEQFNGFTNEIYAYEDSSVLGMYEFSDKELIFPYNNKLLIYNRHTKKAKPINNIFFNYTQTYPHFEKYKNNIYLNYVNEKSENGIIYITPNKEVFKLDIALNEYITCFKFYNNRLYITTRKDLFEYDLIKKTYTKFNINIFCKSLLISKNNLIYVAAVDGLYIYTLAGKRLKKYNITNGLTSDFIYSVLEDNNGDIWCSHNKGISKLNIKNNKITNFDINDGLQSSEFNTGAYYKDETGLLYFGGVNGINIIDPNNIKLNTHEPQIALNKIYLFDEEYKTDSNYNELKSLNLNYTQNTLAFDFSSLDFSNPVENIYKYILEGYDQKIIESGTRHYARYANLPPGNYILKIYGSNNDGIWTKNPKTLNINIVPPFWQKTWFYWIVGASVAVFVIGIIYLIINQQKNKLKRKLEIQRQLEIERLRISRDLHDHVGAQLSYLISNLDWLVTHPNALNKEEELNRLSNLSETGRQAILTLRQTIWALNNTELSTEDFADKYKSFAKKMLEFNPNIHIVFQENISVNHKLSPGVALNLFRICQEALGNALKHSKATEIIVEFKSDMENAFEFKITDNGIGFDVKNSAKEDHYGILNMKARAEEANAQLDIISEIGKGTTIKIHHLHYVNTQE